MPRPSQKKSIRSQLTPEERADLADIKEELRNLAKKGKDCKHQEAKANFIARRRQLLAKRTAPKPAPAKPEPAPAKPEAPIEPADLETESEDDCQIVEQQQPAPVSQDDIETESDSDLEIVGVSQA